MIMVSLKDMQKKNPVSSIWTDDFFHVPKYKASQYSCMTG